LVVMPAIYGGFSRRRRSGAEPARGESTGAQ